MKTIETVDNRKRSFASAAAILTFLAVCIMILSIVSNDNFGDDSKHSLITDDLPLYQEPSLL